MKKFFTLFAILIFMQNIANAACIGQKCTMDRVFGSWKGNSLDDLITQWGYPDTDKTIAGHKLYFWKQGTYRVKTGDRTKTVENCTRIIEVNDSKIITGGKFKGGNCPATKLTAKKWMNPEFQTTDEE